MKRFATLIAVTATLLSTATPALGQTSLLLSGGLNRAFIVVGGEDDELANYLVPVSRISVGLAVELALVEGWNLELGGSYSQKGYGFEVPPSGKASMRIDYFEVAGLVSKPFPLGDRASVNLLAGPALALQLSCQVSASEQGSEETGDCVTEDEEDFGPQDTDLGLAGGVRFRVGLSETVGVTVGALYTLGLRNLFDDVDDDSSVKSRVVTLSVGLAYSIG